MRISDWSSDVCASDLVIIAFGREDALHQLAVGGQARADHRRIVGLAVAVVERRQIAEQVGKVDDAAVIGIAQPIDLRSEETRAGKTCVRTCYTAWSPYT